MATVNLAVRFIDHLTLVYRVIFKIQLKFNNIQSNWNNGAKITQEIIADTFIIGRGFSSEEKIEMDLYRIGIN
ncbi:hypothetical protein AOY38_05390 [Synechocystis sp. PCC 6803]|jgi:hypothetical protein|nr:hypothetical protein AOY38_05390 [Synechocystis sp. PCC 6803]AVP89163.1 hypothetical protein C7I86_05405 [Synechocystis sp. IPPAS B-1465]BAM51358.1 hypothetical protein BEST7613_2427 [Synechocystis sp. PCC 6803] [Bacillus subtilis BEST7613]